MSGGRNGGRSAYEIRSGLDHPVIDADGHTTEFAPALAEYLKEVGIDANFNVLFRDVHGAISDWYDLAPEVRVHKHLTKPPRWTRPMRNARLDGPTL